MFDQFGAPSAATRSAFVAGFKQNYVAAATEEGLVITVLQFSSPGAASAYLEETAPQTLSYAAATTKAFPQIPGAVAVTGTKPYGGEYFHAVVFAEGDYYVQFVYAELAATPAPTEFVAWVRTQYALLAQK